MAWFFNKNIQKDMDIVEPSIKDRVSKIEARLTLFEAEILELATAQDIIRNKVLRKIQFKKEDEEQPKDIYGGMFPRG